MKFNIEKLEKHLKDGYVSKRQHSSGDLFILNYTPKTQFDWMWDDITIQCRGLIVDSQYNIVQRPFKKFFTVEQITQLRNSVHNLFGIKFKDIESIQFMRFDKLDGSLGILYWDKNKDDFQIATRGSFESPQAFKASEILLKYNTSSLNTKKFTYLFEIVYPENRVVVDYGLEEKLVLVAVIDNETGDDVWEEFDRIKDENIFPVAKEFDSLTLSELANLPQIDNSEGFVLVSPNGFRLKYKYEEYKKLHRLLTGVTELSIWEALKNNNPYNLDTIPDEFYDWYTKVKLDLEHRYWEIETGIKVTYGEIKKYNPNITRKELAISLKNYKYRSAIFNIIDGKDYSQIIWNELRPTGGGTVFKIVSSEAD